MNQNRFPAPAGWKGREHWVGVCGLFITLPLLVNDFYCSANGTPSSRPGFTRKPTLGKLYQDRMSPWHASIAHSCLREPRKLKPSCSSLRTQAQGSPRTPPPAPNFCFPQARGYAMPGHLSSSTFYRPKLSIQHGPETPAMAPLPRNQSSLRSIHHHPQSTHRRTPALSKGHQNFPKLTSPVLSACAFNA